MRKALVRLVTVVAMVSGCAEGRPNTAPAQQSGGAAGEGGGAHVVPPRDEAPGAGDMGAPHPSPVPGTSGSPAPEPPVTPPGTDADVQESGEDVPMPAPAPDATLPPGPADAGMADAERNAGDAEPAPPDASQGPADAEIPPPDAEPDAGPPEPACADVAPDLAGELLDCEGTAPCSGATTEHAWCAWAWPDAPPACRYAVVAWAYHLPDCQVPAGFCARVRSDGWCTTALDGELVQSRLETDNVLGWVEHEMVPVVYSSSTGEAFCPVAMRCP